MKENKKTYSNDDDRMSKITFEVKTKEKAGWVRSANQHGLKLIAYIRAKVNGDL